MRDMAKQIGIVITFEDTPNVNRFFVLDQQRLTSVRLNQFVETSTEEGILIGTVVNVIKTNRYFSQLDTLSDISQQGIEINTIFPTNLWEYTLLEIKPIAVYTNNSVVSPGAPPSPGAKVFLADPKILKAVLGLADDGLFLGHLKFQNVEVRVDIDKLLRKHLAILAMSGAGKSYTASVIIEELLSRKKGQGRIAIILFDVHGEYLSFGATDSPYYDNVTIIDASSIQFDLSKIPVSMYRQFLPEMSIIQLRELKKIISHYFNRSKFSIDSLIETILTDQTINVKTRDALVSWLYELKSYNLFEKEEYPNLEHLVKLGKLIIINLSNIISLRKKQMLVLYVTSRLFSLRRKGQIPPFLIVLEEAHQFCPEAKQVDAISKRILETIAREGRKFYASLCLISQRPIKLSTTVLSQCSSQIILRITNPYDLKHIASSNEAIDADTLNTITRLMPGDALITGEITTYPVFIKIRKRVLPETKFEKSICDESKRFEEIN